MRPPPGERGCGRAKVEDAFKQDAVSLGHPNKRSDRKAGRCLNLMQSGPVVAWGVLLVNEQPVIADHAGHFCG